ncbi:MAG: hypothetical protein KKD39_05390 [Candidatus Altiarchaeota archaeon]|nr:hypothetical protein [Candidatus Altiarchaeota archaeon]
MVVGEGADRMLTIKPKIIKTAFFLSIPAGFASAQQITNSDSFFLVLLLFATAGLGVYIKLKKSNNPIQILGVNYDKEKHRIELTVKNSECSGYFIKSALRLVQPSEDIVKQTASDGNIPLAAAKAQVGDRKMYQLICEDDTYHKIDANQTKTICYDILVPKEMLSVEDAKNVEVHIAYGADPTKRYNRGGLNCSAGESTTDDTDYSPKTAGTLLESLKTPDNEIVEYHAENGKDILEMAANIVDDEAFKMDLSRIDTSSPDEVKAALISVLDEHLESAKHPYLRKVSADSKFILKKDHDQIVSQIEFLEELAEAVLTSESDALKFHLRCGNDFAEWIQTSVGDAELAQSIRSIDYNNVDDAKKQFATTIFQRVDSLKD